MWSLILQVLRRNSAAKAPGHAPAGRDYLCPEVAASDAHTASEASEPASAVKPALRATAVLGAV